MLRHRQELAFGLGSIRADLERRRLAMHSVYECDDCGEGYLGQQRCSDCSNRFCRAVGLGGSCPGCDKTVLIADLLGEAEEARR